MPAILDRKPSNIATISTNLYAKQLLSDNCSTVWFARDDLQMRTIP